MKGKTKPLKNRLNELIQERGFRKTWIAKQLGVEPSTISSWCRNRTQPQSEIYKDKLAELLGCSKDKIFFDDNVKSRAYKQKCIELLEQASDEQINIIYKQLKQQKDRKPNTSKKRR